ncbi:MAG: hypothetical protein ACE5RP_00200 [Nitrosopumilus sp.]
MVRKKSKKDYGALYVITGISTVGAGSSLTALLLSLGMGEGWKWLLFWIFIICSIVSYFLIKKSMFVTNETIAFRKKK